MTSTTTHPSTTGREYTAALHQLVAGDLVLWNDQWLIIESVTRNPEAINPVHQVLAYVRAFPGYRCGVAYITGEECQTVTYVPALFARKAS